MPKTYVMFKEGDCLSAISQLKTSPPGTWISKVVKKTSPTDTITILEYQAHEEFLLQYDYGR